VELLVKLARVKGEFVAVVHEYGLLHESVPVVACALHQSHCLGSDIAAHHGDGFVMHPSRESDDRPVLATCVSGVRAQTARVEVVNEAANKANLIKYNKHGDY
jgi:hypothetical protein